MTSIVPDLLAHSSRRYPHKECVIDGDRTLTFSDVSERAGRLAAVLRSRGLEGERVALLALNEVEFLEIRVATQRVGAIFVPLNYRMNSAELQRVIVDSKPKLLIVGPECEALASDLAVPEVLWLKAQSGADCGYEREIYRMEPEPIPIGLPADRIDLLAYTSGTSSRPKGVMLSNGATHAITVQMGYEMGASPNSTYLAANPMFHIGHTVGFAFVYLGGTHRQLRRFDVDQFLGLLERRAMTHTQLVPTMIRSILDKGGEEVSGGMKRIMYGAAPMPTELLNRALASWGCEFLNGYGTTEAMGLSMLAPHEHDPVRLPHLLSSVGRSSLGMTVSLEDETGGEASVGEIGEIIAYGPNLMQGYWNQPDETATAMRNGWLHTGDLAYRDDQGYLYVVDRKGDRIVTGGENVYPAEVEKVLATHPHVMEASVFGVPDLQWGETVSAAVVLHSRSRQTSNELIRFCRSKLPGFKTPKAIQIVSELPRTATGKVLRRTLRNNWVNSN